MEKTKEWFKKNRRKIEIGTALTAGVVIGVIAQRDVDRMMDAKWLIKVRKSIAEDGSFKRTVGDLTLTVTEA
jgi:hypothetical protein